MPEDSTDLKDLIPRLARGDPDALAGAFSHFRARLRRMVQLRLDRRLQGRVDTSDVLQDAYLDAAARAADYAANPTMPFFLWLRYLTGQRLLMLHRQHLGTRMRDVGQEVSLYRGAMPQASSASLAAHLLGRLTTPSRAAIRVEMQQKLQEALNGMDLLDREVLTLRHFEELSNNEVAAVLGIQKSAASNRYIRALKRLKEVLSGIPGFLEG